ncbi:MAG: M20 family peptidase [Proteobacteria bacterium]|nr:M20 family peptidase [Pseudomonadota bacterium]
MKGVLKIGGVLLGALLLLVLAIAVRAATWKPPVPPPAAHVAPPVEVDVAGAARHLSEAIRFRTVSNQDASKNDWSQWDRFHDWLRTAYPHANAAMTRQDLGRTLIWTWKGSDPSLKPMVLMAHQDVVPVEVETLGRWRHAPFSGEIAEGAVWGRGSVDDKGSLIGLMETADALAAKGFKPRRTIMIVSGHDEEVLGSGARAAAAWFKAQNITPEFVLDEGMLALGHDPLNNKPIAPIGISEKGYATLRITAHGKGGHSSAPPDETAVQVLAKAVDRIASDRFPLRFDGPGADMVRVLAADANPTTRALIANDWLFGGLIARKMGAVPAAGATLRTTIAPTVLEGSPKENVLPQTATALINYRLHPRDTLASVMARARRDVRGLDVELAWNPNAAEASPVASTRSEAWRVLSTLAAQETAARPAPSLFNGATDARHMSLVTRDIYRFQPIRIEAAEIEMFHGVNEHMSLENLKRAVGFYERLMLTEGDPR